MKKPIESESIPSASCEQCAEYLNGWKRAQADYQNLQKETEEVKQAYVKYANEHLLLDLLPAIDQFETALSFVPDFSTMPDDDRKKMENWMKGINAVKQLWEQSFAEIGLKRIDTKGVFDPSLHEASATESHADRKEGEVICEVQSGWLLGEKVLQPAKVIVNTLK